MIEHDFRTCGIASLRHEPFDVSVKFAAVVISGGGERDEILGRLWTFLAVQLQLEVTYVAVQCHRHGDDEKYRTVSLEPCEREQIRKFGLNLPKSFAHERREVLFTFDFDNYMH